MSSNGNDGLTSSSNEISFASKYYVNDDNDFKKELIKVLEEGLKDFLKMTRKKVLIDEKKYYIHPIFFSNMLLQKKVKF